MSRGLLCSESNACRRSCQCLRATQQHCTIACKCVGSEQRDRCAVNPMHVGEAANACEQHSSTAQSHASVSAVSRGLLLIQSISIRNTFPCLQATSTHTRMHTDVHTCPLRCTSSFSAYLLVSCAITWKRIHPRCSTPQFLCFAPSCFSDACLQASRSAHSAVCSRTRVPASQLRGRVPVAAARGMVQ